jgi:hypothetical protein
MKNLFQSPLLDEYHQNLVAISLLILAGVKLGLTRISFSILYTQAPASQLCSPSIFPGLLFSERCNLTYPTVQEADKVISCPV